MSGIYIKGMEMPKSCEECAIKSWDMEDYVCPFSRISTLCISRQANCPLISVPDHGDLIDRDMVLEKAWDVETFVDAVKYAPTIIAADKDGAE